METLGIALALALVAVVVAVILQRRRRPMPATPARGSPPDRIDPEDLGWDSDAGQGPTGAGREGEDRWWLVVFGSDSCFGCGRMVERSRALSRADLAVVSVTLQDRPDLHRRYSITAVPTTVIADAEGAVRKAWVGEVPAERFSAEVLGVIARR